MGLAKSMALRDGMIAAVVLSGIGCASVSPSRFAVMEQLPERLPVRLEIDAKSFAANTGAHKAAREVSDELARSWEKMHPMAKLDTTAVIRNTVYADPRENKEIIEHIQTEMERNVIDHAAEATGVATCRLVYRDSHRGVRPWFFFASSVATLFVPNLLGYPIGSTSTELELELTIQDNTGGLVSAYRSRGSGTGYSAMFWGYSLVNASVPYSYGAAPRASYLKALREAVRGLIEQTQRDSATIKAKLTR